MSSRSLSSFLKSKVTSETIGSLRGRILETAIVVVQISSKETCVPASCIAPRYINSTTVVKVFDLCATGHGFNPRLGPALKFYRILVSNSSANHISIQCMLIGSTQVLQGHCPLVYLQRSTQVYKWHFLFSFLLLLKTSQNSHCKASNTESPQGSDVLN